MGKAFVIPGLATGENPEFRIGLNFCPCNAAEDRSNPVVGSGFAFGAPE